MQAAFQSFCAVRRADVQQRGPDGVERVHQRFGVVEAFGELDRLIPPGHGLREVISKHAELSVRGEGAAQLSTVAEWLQQLERLPDQRRPPLRVSPGLVKGSRQRAQQPTHSQPIAEPTTELDCLLQGSDRRRGLVDQKAFTCATLEKVCTRLTIK